MKRHRSSGVCGRADIEEARAVGEFDDVVDVGGDADVFVEEFGGLVGGEAGFWCSEGQRGRNERQHGELAQPAQGHNKSSWGIAARVTRSGLKGKRLRPDWQVLAYAQM